MGALSAFFFNKSNIWVALITTAIMIFYAAVIMGGQSTVITEQLPNDGTIPDLWIGMNMEKLSLFFGSLDESGIQAYRNMLLIWDNIFPLIYCTMYIFWLSFLFRKSETAHKYALNLYPIVLLITDWVENSLELQLMNQYILEGSMETNLVKFTSMTNISKWSFSAVNYLLILIGVVYFILNRKSSPKQSSHP